jgi:LmbE family N-acetylglucosaminyl deacetylase
MTKFYVPARAMAIAAHPDDIEFTCAGTLARWVRMGTRTSYVLCTSGEVGIAEAGMTKERATIIREGEAQAAADLAGASEVTFLREPDGLLQPTLNLRKRLVREIRRFRPEVVICSDPTAFFMGENYINHPDHRAAGQAALDAVFPAAGQPHLFQELEAEGLRAHKPRKVYIYGRFQTELFVNIDDTIDLKISALKAHVSQVKDFDPEKWIRDWAAQTAKGKEMEYAEAFKVITLIDDQTWEKSQSIIAG